MASRGTKVTTDPEGLRNPIQEGTGFVASDSLAAESLSSGGDFASNDPNAAADPQRAHGSTANTTDTSAASRLDPAPSAAERDDNTASYDGPGAVSGGAGKSAGRGPTYNIDSGSGSGSGSGANNTHAAADRTQAGNSTPASGTDSPARAGVAPTYVAVDRDSNAAGRVGGPKGANLTEGGFGEDAPNASFNGDIGGRNDPGRVAEAAFEARNSQNAADAGGSGPRQGGVDGANQYDALGEERA